MTTTNTQQAGERTRCEGHETTNGPIGSTFYCDGSCTQSAPLAYDCDRCDKVVARDDISWNEEIQEHLCPSCQAELDDETEEEGR